MLMSDKLWQLCGDSLVTIWGERAFAAKSARDDHDCHVSDVGAGDDLDPVLVRMEEGISSTLKRSFRTRTLLQSWMAWSPLHPCKAARKGSCGAGKARRTHAFGLI